ncbi:MAG: GNAT family N-acetyltransferase [Lawsonibacter sp.]
MAEIRLSRPEDEPRLRALWAAAFGDSGDYVDNYFRCYYKPERMFVLEEAGQLCSMTAWFDTALCVPGQGTFRAAYLYAVATAPHCRGEGKAGELLKAADRWFAQWSIPAVTTVPAEPSLHRFFEANGFRECFTYTERRADVSVTKLQSLDVPTMVPISPQEYVAGREACLAESVHIAFPEDAMVYQMGACELTPDGGLYRVDTEAGTAYLCLEGMEDGRLLGKELLGPPRAQELVLRNLFQLLPSWCGVCRVPGEEIQFGMLKWLDPAMKRNWNWSRKGYLGLGFD